MVLLLDTNLGVKFLTQDPMVRGFLLTNLLTGPNEPARFKVPLRILGNSLGELADFPVGPGGRTWKDGQVVAIKGKRSKWVPHSRFSFRMRLIREPDRYINKHSFPVMQDMFPGVVLEELDTGHWVHSEAYVSSLDMFIPKLTTIYSPREFLQTVYKYIK